MEEYIQRFLQLGKPPGTAACEQVNLIQLVEDVLPLVEPAARHAHVELRWFPRTHKAILAGDASRLRQLAINLLINAIEAAAQGAARDHRPAEVMVEVRATPAGGVALSVTDTGPGPAASVRDKLFEPFVTEKVDGVGIGLSVASDVVREHGGTIEWQRSGDRTCFEVSLPCASGADTSRPKPANLTQHVASNIQHPIQHPFSGASRV
jgi:C4-dicarboxylate-specific signal transduction histidine kinase